MPYALRVISRRLTLINADEKWQRAERKALREVSSEQLAVRSKAVVGCLPASCPLFYCLLPLLSPQHSLLSTQSAPRLAACWCLICANCLLLTSLSALRFSEADS